MEICNLKDQYALIIVTAQNLCTLKTNDMIHDHNTRCKKDIRFKCAKSRTYQSPLVLGAKLFNALPKEFKTMEIEVLQQKLKEYLIEKCFYSVEEYLDSV